MVSRGDKSEEINEAYEMNQLLYNDNTKTIETQDQMRSLPSEYESVSPTDKNPIDDNAVNERMYSNKGKQLKIRSDFQTIDINQYQTIQNTKSATLHDTPLSRSSAKSRNKKRCIDKCCTKRLGLFRPCRPSNNAK